MYKLRTDKIKDENGSSYTVYGFDAVFADGTENTVTYPDIFFERERAEKLVKLLNESDVDKRQIPEIVNDAVCEACTLNILR